MHPNLYDWPLPGCTHPEAGLGFCNWTPGTAADVRAQIVAGGLHDIAGTQLAFANQHVVVSLAEGATAVNAELVDLRDLVGDDNDDSDDAQTPSLVVKSVRATVAIVATGYLPERRAKDPEIESGSYWRPPSSQEEPTRPAFVVGDGDGALNEVLRLRYGSAVSRLIQLAGATETFTAPDALRLRAEEARRRNQPNTSSLAELRQLTLSGLAAALESDPGDDVTVSVHSTEPFMTADSFLLNRSLVVGLTKVAPSQVTLDPQPGRLTETQALEQAGDMKQANETRAAKVYWRIGPPQRTAATSLAAPAVDPKRLVTQLHAGESVHLAGAVGDLLDMTRHSWWRAQHPGSALERPEHPGTERPAPDLHRHLQLIQERGARAGTPLDAALRRWPEEPIGGLARRLQWAMASVARVAGDTTAWWLLPGPSAAVLVLSIDAVGLLCDAPPRSVAFCVARDRPQGITLVRHDQRLLLAYQRNTPPLELNAKESNATEHYHDGIVEHMLTAPPTPDSAWCKTVLEPVAPSTKELTEDQKDWYRRYRGPIFDCGIQTGAGGAA